MTISSRNLRRRSAVLLLGVACLCVPNIVSATASSKPIPTVTGDAKVDKLLSKMTLDEKLTMIEGQKETATDREYQAGYLAGIPRLGIPSLKLSDGPPGIMTKENSPGMTATMGVAATFSTQDAKQNGVVIGRDAKALGQDVALEPFVNMDRDTTFSRGFNTYGEDPLLTGQTGASTITGIQSQGTMAQVKHYIAYDGSNNVTVDEQTLHELYLQPFTDAVNAGVSSIMCSYNAVNTAQACGNSQIMTDILRNELGFKGFTTSDWGANHSTSYINAGLDMEMPGGAFFTADALKAAIKNGTVQTSRITEAVGRILYEYDQFGLLDGKSKHNVTKVPVNADEKIIQTTGEDAATLLQNSGDTLPLDGSSSLALIGPGAGQTIATDGGGEKSGGLVDQQVGTYQALQQSLGSKAQLSYAVADDMTGTPVPASALSHDGKAGLLRTDASGTTSTDKTLNLTAAEGTSLPAGSTTTWTGTLTAPEAGSYWLDLQALGATGSLSVDGKSLTSLSARYGTLHPTDGNGPLPTTDGIANARAQITLAAGAHTVTVTEKPDASGAPVQTRLAWVTPSQQQADHDAAVKAAKKAKTAVVFAWSSGDLSKPLPEGQDQLISDIAAVNPNTVVVLNTSQPVAMPWASKVKSVLEMWYPGDRGGFATANVLLGTVNPGGKLPFTWPASLDQEVAQQPGTHPERTSAGASPAGQLCTAGGGGGSSGANPACTTTYSEGINIGYRFYDATGETPLYPFGYGLSYTSFSYSGLDTAVAADGGLTVSFKVKNTGTAAGDAVPQVYLGAPVTKPAGAQFAAKSLAGYSRVHVAPGATSTVSIHVPLRQLQYWSTSAGWTTATGQRTLSIGTTARADAVSKSVTIG